MILGYFDHVISYLKALPFPCPNDLAALVVSNNQRYVIQQFSVFHDPLYFLIVPVNTYIVQWLNQFAVQNDE